MSILERRFIGTLSDTKGLSGDANAAVVQSVHGDWESVANTLDDVLHRDLAVVEDQSASIG